MKMTRLLIGITIGLLLCIISPSTYGQEPAEEPEVSAATSIQVGANFFLGFPQGGFRRNVERIGIGASGQFLYNISHTPLHIGVDLSFLEYGRDSRREPFSSSIPDVLVNVITTNEIFMFHFILRFQPPQGKLRPYFSALFGGHYLSTVTKIQSINSTNQDNEIASYTNFDDFVPGAGASAGLLILLARAENIPVFRDSNPTSTKGSLEFSLDLHGTYLLGGRADYLKEGSIIRSNGDITFDVSSSRTDLFLVQIGLVLGF